jgi:hypothetical protein
MIESIVYVKCPIEQRQATSTLILVFLTGTLALMNKLLAGLLS